MKVKTLSPARYQLSKVASNVVLSGHPWIYRDNLSSAAEVFEQGQWLKLFDAENEVLGYGILEKNGLIGIRVLKRGSRPPDIAWIHTQLEKVIKKRDNVKLYTEAIRYLHGENDGFPGVVIDVYGDTAVLQTYSTSVDPLGRYLGSALVRRLSLKNLIWKLPVKRKVEASAPSVRVLRGHLPGKIPFREGKLHLTVEVGAGQKSGTFLDLRGLRKWITLQRWNGKKVLNLFSYSGTLGLAAELAGAREIWNVDISEGALEFGKKYHALDHKHYKWVQADIFEWVQKLSPSEKFDVIIVDPPSMASQTSQVPTALKAYQNIYRALLPHLVPHGLFIACCCTSRIARKRFRENADRVLVPRVRFKTEIKSEEDHPVGFPEGDYLKLFVYD